jgi:carbon-monoxide dehydrogenase medium subunit
VQSAAAALDKSIEKCRRPKKGRTPPMNLWQEYKRPASVAEAIQSLTTASGPAMPIAGGTDLLLDLKQGRHTPVHTLIDLTFVPEMSLLELRGDELFIGAAVPVNRVALDPLTGTHAQALVEACNLIAGPQVRNTATLGGNVAHALPAADGTIALTALEAQAEVASYAPAAVPGGDSVSIRRVPFTSLFLGPGKSALDKSKEIIVGFYLPLTNYHQASCFKRIMRPQGVALPILNCAVWLERESDVVKDIHIAVGPGSSIPFRATEAEATLRGQAVNSDALNRTMESLLGQAHFRTSARRASADYRRHIVGGLFGDVFEAAWSRAE